MDPYIGEIRLFAGNYAPADWAFCEGQILPIQGNQALFTIIGATYGGDGRSTFALPDLRGLAPMHQGSGPGLTPRPFASTGGDSEVTLLESQIPNHSHAPACQTTANGSSPVGTVWATTPGSGRAPGPAVYAQSPTLPMNPQALQAVGGYQPHNNMQPWLAVSFIIALDGVYPVKS